LQGVGRPRSRRKIDLPATRATATCSLCDAGNGANDLLRVGDPS